MRSWKEAIDKGTALCGSQKEFAERLGLHPQHLSNSKTGARPIPKEKIAVMACLLDTDPAHLWELQEIANLPRRNPFTHAASTLIACFFGVILSAGGNDAKADAYRANVDFNASEQTIHCRLFMSRLWGVLAAMASSLVHRLPMLRHA